MMLNIIYVCTLLNAVRDKVIAAEKNPNFLFVQHIENKGEAKRNSSL